MSLLERYLQPAESQLPTVSHQGEIPSGQPTCTITIDGREVTAVVGEAILRAAQRAGFNVPTLCDDEKLAPAAACRMCLVEIEGYDRPMPSCHLPVEPGMKVTATSDGLFGMRKQNLEYILSDHNAYCMPPCQIGCPTHIDIPGYLELMAKGQHVEAARRSSSSPRTCSAARAARACPVETLSARARASFRTRHEGRSRSGASNASQPTMRSRATYDFLDAVRAPASASRSSAPARQGSRARASSRCSATT